MGHSRLPRILSSYLAEHHLAKIACLTNCLPRRDDAREIVHNLNYVCFCVPNRYQQVEALCLAYLCGYRMIEYDVTVSTAEEAILRRQFAFVCLRFDSPSSAQLLVDYIAEHKQMINRNYPILVRLLCKGYRLGDGLNNVVLRAAIGEGDTVLEVA
jgi:hypothetical protein